MPAHDWTKTHPQIFHDFHIGWVVALNRALNMGLLPTDYYALIEQHNPPIVPYSSCVEQAGPPRTGRRVVGSKTFTKGTPRTLAIRHVSGHRLVAMIEIVSPANKDRRKHVASFVSKGIAALGAGVHLMIVDLFPPGPFDKYGVAAMIWRSLARKSKEAAPADEPLTIASFISMSPPNADFFNFQVGAALPSMALYLKPNLDVEVPLDATYAEAFQGLPEFWRNVVA